MQAKAQQVTSFIDKDLLQIIEDAFGQINETRIYKAIAAVENAIEQAKSLAHLILKKQMAVERRKPNKMP